MANFERGGQKGYFCFNEDNWSCLGKYGKTLTKSERSLPVHPNQLPFSNGKTAIILVPGKH